MTRGPSQRIPVSSLWFAGFFGVISVVTGNLGIAGVHTIESNPPQFSEPQDLNSGVTVESGAMESDGDPTPAGLVQVGTSLNATPPSSHALASVRVPLSPRRSSRKRAASTVHSDAPPSKIISAESSGVPVITADSGRRTRRKPKPWGVVHDNQTYTSLEFLVQFPDEYRSLYGDAEPA
ncbi:hypothetical protein B0H10DRAFT_1961660 [Mycena sp. CBHHK59/15]|nr:hypothetical protein B0H10DRAFT_1961660 [Mycena sp. CBHHK59/15]